MENLIVEEIWTDDCSDISEEKEIYRITDLVKASQAFRELTEINKKIKSREIYAEKEHERINNWLEKEYDTDYKRIIRLEGLLRQYYEEQKEQDKNFKLSTPYGKVTARKQQPTWEYKENAVEVLKEHGLFQLIRTKEEVNKAEAKKVLKKAGNHAVTEDGEIIEAIIITENEPKINIELAKI